MHLYYKINKSHMENCECIKDKYGDILDVCKKHNGFNFYKYEINVSYPANILFTYLSRDKLDVLQEELNDLLKYEYEGYDNGMYDLNDEINRLMYNEVVLMELNDEEELLRY